MTGNRWAGRRWAPRPGPAPSGPACPGTRTDTALNHLKRKKEKNHIWIKTIGDDECPCNGASQAAARPSPRAASGPLQPGPLSGRAGCHKLT
ncbi:hypothetical protein E2C01_018351 [Portunus trituberculatus]|uniref:Uncharacterized protein n=1 Tax=Portunus trituberculatus TaxID=210409 RepID=A0A5B7DW79_PORTR|nr:hypothetical protein [Portunus trituberculatus]